MIDFDNSKGPNTGPSVSRFLARISIRKRLVLSSGISVFLICLFCTWLWISLNSVRNTVQVTMTKQVELASHAEQLARNVINVQQFLSDISATRGLDGLDDGFKKADDEAKEFRANLKSFRQYYESIGDEESVTLAKRIWGAFEAYYQAGVIMAQGYVDAGPSAGNALMPEFDKASDELQRDLQILVNKHDLAAKENVVQVAEQVRTVNFYALALCATVIFLTVVAGALISWSIVRPLNFATSVADRISHGDLTKEVLVDKSSQDEISKLLVAMATMQQTLSLTIAKVNEQALVVSSESEQLAVANADLSRRTEEQANALQETSSSMEQLGGAVRQNSDNVLSADNLATSATEVAHSCGTMVADVVTMMGELNASSHQINEIVGLIDSIAFQTNILALNAAVEAARAGEQGRGFAVVATEVRALAGRTAAAAKEIKVLISDSVGRVEKGTGLADSAGRSMTKVVESIGRVNGLVGEIRLATHEQHSSIGLVIQAVNNMDRTTQENASLVEQTAQVANGLKEQANELLGAISVFKIPAVSPLRIA
ncbi:methyl-accepting chemotaxis protein [Rhodoferax mekongensis]|uniref:methyl-accepting chemotaxis protein n=1 Tax=Rhodoferax mekongensis TaxID=3068341 RepID=UPI0028BDCCCF|nr:methyl-accepting chemotaxis protein [Rhodoferax sp. TBRC 17199]MDT7517040.1 methyl-accepting chemotaxis protein [Rhodoferax sp. TBRC 17199]